MLKLFIKSLWSICYLYMLLILFMLLLYKLFLFSPLYFNIILMLLLSYGILKDKRFGLFRKTIFIILILIQVFIYQYLGYIPILIIKDLFWFSLVLNTSFVWHNLILIWLYDFFQKKDNKYWCYIISRLGLLTSLSIINIILSSLLLMFEKLTYYYCVVYYIKIYKKPFILELITTIMVMLYKFNSYFIKLFSIYSLLIMGKIKGNFKFNLDLLKRIFFIIFFLILSLVLGTPRIYLIWIYYITYDILLKLINVVPFWFKYNHVVRNMTFLDDLKSSFLDDLKKDSLLNYWKLMDHDIYYDYYGFLENCSWFPEGYGCYLYEIKDVLSLFIYDPNYRIFLYVIYIGHLRDDLSPPFSDIDLLNMFNIYKINCTLEVYYEINKKFIDNGEFKDISLNVAGVNFFKYMIGLPKGRFILNRFNSH